MNVSVKKTIIFSLSLLIVFFFPLYSHFIRPTATRIKTLKRVIPQKEKELSEMQTMQKQIITLKNQKNKNSRPLVMVLEETAEKLDLKQNIISLKPTIISSKQTLDEVNVHLNFDYISLEQLINYLNAINHLQRMITISELKIESSEFKENQLSVFIEFKELTFNLQS